MPKQMPVPLCSVVSCSEHHILSPPSGWLEVQQLPHLCLHLAAVGIEDKHTEGSPLPTATGCHGTNTHRCAILVIGRPTGAAAAMRHLGCNHPKHSQDFWHGNFWLEQMKSSHYVGTAKSKSKVSALLLENREVFKMLGNSSPT